MIHAARPSGGETEVAIIGAGPAGSLLAYRLALAGCSVTLLDKERFPRPKVCGGCLGAIGAAALSDAGIDLTTIGVDSAELQRVRIHSGSRTAELPLDDRRAIARDQFDAALLELAEQQGVQVVTGARAKVGPVEGDRRSVEVTASGSDRRRLRCRLVIVAAGLGSHALLPAEDRPASVTRRQSRIGAGATLDARHRFADRGVVTMACGQPGEGYVGLAVLPDGRVDIAAALGPAAIPSDGGVGRLSEQILKRCRIDIPEGLTEAAWRATPALTQRPTRLGAERVLLVGDAAGYVEPFTGEGIGWALRSALEAEPIALDALKSWRPDSLAEWERRHAATMGRWQARCGRVCDLVGARGATPWVVGALSLAPWAAAPLLRRIDPPANAGSLQTQRG